MASAHRAAQHPAAFKGLIDADNHYYEPDDCCTRFLEPAYADRAVHVVRDEGGVGRWFFGAAPLTFSALARDHVMAPGDGLALFEGETAADGVVRADYPPWRDRDARLALMDRQGLKAAILNPTFGLTFEEEIAHDPEASAAAIRAFNKWLETDWGYAYKDRIFTTPLISLSDADEARKELDRLLASGARLVGMRLGPPVFGRSPADPMYDPLWARLQEADVPLVLHISVPIYFKHVAAMWGEPTTPSEEELDPFLIMTCMGDRPAVDTIAHMMVRGVFDRFPRLKIVSLENGSGWVKNFFKMERSFQRTKTTTGADRALGSLKRTPGQVARENLWVSPYPEESYRNLIDLIGPTQVLYGSDWPHPEGTATPATLLDGRLDTLTGDELNLVAHDNVAALLKLRA